MKCPYRKKTCTVNGATIEQFIDCYLEECPLYSDGRCARAEVERKVFNKDIKLEDFTYERESNA